MFTDEMFRLCQGKNPIYFHLNISMLFHFGFIHQQISAENCRISASEFTVDFLNNTSKILIDQ